MSNAYMPKEQSCFRAGRAIFSGIIRPIFPLYLSHSFIQTIFLAINPTVDGLPDRVFV